jgi:hypothetical protein
MWYILDKDNKPIKSNVIQCGEWMEDNPCVKALKQEHIGNIYVSTVFLGLDHAWYGKIPVLWETMIFGGEHDQYQDRYTSVENAEIGHQFAVQLVKNSNI